MYKPIGRTDKPMGSTDKLMGQAYKTMGPTYKLMGKITCHAQNKTGQAKPSWEMQERAGWVIQTTTCPFSKSFKYFILVGTP